MNIHPLLVHFPIALLVLYSVLEIAASLISRLREQTWVFAIKAFLLGTGVLGALLALVSGGIAEDLISDRSRAYIVELHSTFAGATTLLYVILAAAYTVRIFRIQGWSSRIAGTNLFLNRVLRLKEHLAHLVIDTWALPVVATLAFGGMLVTGALGAAIVYGPNIDPFVSFIYHLFWVQ